MDLLDVIINDDSNDTGALVEVLETLTDGELGNNDLETILMYDDENSVYNELSSRLEVIDTRLDWTNQLLAEGFGFVWTGIVLYFSIRFFAWLGRVAGV